MMSGKPGIDFSHLWRLSDSTGLFEHAQGAVPRRNHGYCVDDAGRGLVVLGRESRPGSERDASLSRLVERYLAFISHAQVHTGALHNRLSFERRWYDSAGSGDWWGRALWGLGTIAARWDSAWMRAEALVRFDISVIHRSSSRRAMAMAALGAAEVLSCQPEHQPARTILEDAAKLIGRPRHDVRWPWPEHRLYYANAVLPETLLAAGHFLSKSELIDDGLMLLSWLSATESRDGHLSVTPVGGWSADQPRPGFDQQPIEVAALADAFARAWAISCDPMWTAGLRMCVDWFAGDNDLGVPMMDLETGGGFDGLSRGGPSLNQGAESTLALLSTLQHGRDLHMATS
jgi:hypothetical protein